MDSLCIRQSINKLLYVTLFGLFLVLFVVLPWSKAGTKNEMTSEGSHVTGSTSRNGEEGNDPPGTETFVPDDGPDYQILLNTRENSSSGLVYIQTGSELHFLCNDGFTEDDASVVCRELGFKKAVIYQAMSSFPYTRYTSYTPVLKQLNCTGSESTIRECEGFQLRNVTSCTWFASVICFNRGKPYRLRLVNGDSLGSGLVEMEVGGVWGTFCAIRNFDDHLADILCREMDYTGGVALPRGELGRANISKVWVPYISCVEGRVPKESLLECIMTLHTENIIHDYVDFRNNRYKNEYMACLGEPSFATAVQCFKHKFQGR